MLHMERMSSIRDRIVSRLLQTSFLKCKPKPSKGVELLELLKQGEMQMLTEIADTPNDQRLTRQQMKGILDAQETRTTDKELATFMSRAHFETFLTESPEDQATAQTAKTLEI